MLNSYNYYHIYNINNKIKMTVENGTFWIIFGMGVNYDVLTIMM